ncbi:DUF6415 family natural product biosynthesis protein [Streptomyces sp. NPDC093250]|uniref:DUF6415 family natural product biosynthesis protein n=1 Tax=Streptomyces sp. NPDC093250 TaxID=3366036 RepID=UPI003821AC9E
MNTNHPGTEAGPAGIGSMRAVASWFIDRPTLPRHGDVARFDHDFRRHLDQLLPLLEELTDRRDSGDIQARAALAGVREARRWLTEPEAAGLAGEVARVKRLACAVLALCDHHETLTSNTAYLTHDRPLTDGPTSH